MKIIHVSDITKFGGIQTLVIQLTKYQSSDPKMVIGILSPFKKNLNKMNTIDSKVRIFYGNLNSGFDFRFNKLLKIFKLFREYDLVHFHGFNIFLILCAKLAKRKIVFTEHGTFQKANQKINWRKYLNKRILGYFILEHFVTKVIFNSNWLKNNVALKSKNIAVILNGAVPTYKDSGAQKKGDANFNVLTIARFVHRKHVDRLITAFSYLKNSKNYFLHLVGDGPLLSDLKSQAQEMLMEKTYKFYGYRSNVSSFYKSADLFVLPTEFEPFGLVVLEAMYAKIPVVCFVDGGGALEIINDIHPKLIVKDEVDLCEAIKYWKAHDEERIIVGEVLYKRAISKFSVERMVSDYFSVYKEVLRGIN